MKSPLFLCILLVALCASSPFFAYARSADPAASPSDAGAQTSEVVTPGSASSLARRQGVIVRSLKKHNGNSYIANCGQQPFAQF